MVDKINPLGNINAHNEYNNTRRATSESRAEDSLTLSSDIMRLSGISDIRLDRVLQLKQQFANKTYPMEKNLDIALDRAIDDVLGSSSD